MESTRSEIPNIMDISNENISNLQGMLDGMLSDYELSDKQLELTGEVVSALAMHGRFEILDKIIKNMCQQQMERLLTNEPFLRALIALKFEQRQYKDVVNFLQRGQFSSYVGLLEIWDEAHYAEKEAKLGHKLSPLIRFRVRQKNPPPKNICPSGERPSSKLSAMSKDVLNKWFMENLSNPYPSQETKQVLANRAGLTTYQVKTWFANARRRHRLAGMPTISGNQRTLGQGFFQEHHNNNYSSTLKKSVSPPQSTLPKQQSYSQSSANYQNSVSPVSYNQCNMVNVQKSPILSQPPEEFQTRNALNIHGAGYLKESDSHCSGYCIRELARMCEKLKNVQSSQTNRAPVSPNVPQWPSPGVGLWQSRQDTPLPWGSNHTQMMNMTQHTPAPVDVFYHADEAPSYPTCNLLPHYFQASTGYSTQSGLQTVSDEFGHQKYCSQGVNYIPYQQNESSPRISPSSSTMLSPSCTEVDRTDSHNDTYTSAFEPVAFQTLHPQSEREVAMVLLDLSSERSTQSSQSSQSSLF